MQTSKKLYLLPVVLFYAIAVAVRYGAFYVDTHQLVTNGLLKTILFAAGPALGALCVCKLFHIPFALRFTGAFRGKMQVVALFVLLPPVLFGAVDIWEHGTVNSLLSTILVTVYCILYALLEEAGWRGFLDNYFSNLAPWLRIVLVALMWFAWHLNWSFSSSSLLFFGLLLLGSWGIGLVARKTGSWLAVGGFHALHNWSSNMHSSYSSYVLAVLVVVWVLYLRRTIPTLRKQSQE